MRTLQLVHQPHRRKPDPNFAAVLSSPTCELIDALTMGVNCGDSTIVVTPIPNKSCISSRVAETGQAVRNNAPALCVHLVEVDACSLPCAVATGLPPLLGDAQLNPQS